MTKLGLTGPDRKTRVAVWAVQGGERRVQTGRKAREQGRARQEGS